MKAIEAAHRKAVEAAQASGRAMGGQPYDGHPPPAYEVYRDALFAALSEDDAAVERIKAAMRMHIGETVNDSDAVCTTCRYRAGHGPGCPRFDEPWPTVTVFRPPTPDEQARAAIRAMGGE